MSATIQTVDLGTKNRDRSGRFAKTYTLSYSTYIKGTYEVVKLVRHLPADSIEYIGKVISKAADRGVCWDIEVLDSDGNDCTFDFACFQDSPTAPEPEALEKVTFNLDASRYGYAGTTTVVATDPAALKLHAEGNSIRRYWRVDSIEERRVTELDPAVWIAKYAR